MERFYDFDSILLSQACAHSRNIAMIKALMGVSSSGLIVESGMHDDFGLMQDLRFGQDLSPAAQQSSLSSFARRDLRRSASDEMEQILDAPPALADTLLKGGTRLTRRWSHGELHAALPALDTHVIMTYYGTAQKALWRRGSSRIESRTRKGAITLIPEGDDGRWDVDGPIEVSHVYLPDWRLQAAGEALGIGSKIELVGRNCFDDPSSAQLLELLSREAGSDDTATTLFVEQAIDLLCTQLVRSHSSYGVAPATAPRRGLADWQIKRVNDYMAEAMHREITLDELATLVQLSRFHFCASFKLATGMTPHEWLTALRMRRAGELLVKTDLSVIQIGLEVGYQTPSAFAASFRRVMKETPTAYRRAGRM